MKGFLLFLGFLLPTFLMGQGWVLVSLQTDLYAPETSWVIVQDNNVLEESPLYPTESYNEKLVFLEPGNYDFIIYDSFGDGICCAFGEGYFTLSNACGLDTTVYDFASSELVLPFEVLPCPPPIFGCSDPQAVNYNPWANVSQPCAYPPQPCGEGETTVIVTVTPDTYAGEISWALESNGVEVLSGSEYSIVGLPITYDVCVSVGDTLVLEVMDTFGDGMCGSCYGGVDGNISITTLCQDTLYYVGDTVQYSTISSGLIGVEECVLEIAEGCTDYNFTEYDPLALIDDGSCATEVILGCTIPGSLNFNPDANTLETNPLCMSQLTLTDGAGDGWFGSWLGVVQGDEIFGPFQMGPNDGVEESFYLPLYSGEPIQVYFFTGGNAETTAAQCGFLLTSPQGIFMQAGTNPWNDAIKKFPYTYTGVPFCNDLCVEAVVGCMNPQACDYDSQSNVEGDCTLPIEFYNCSNECIFDTDNDGVCDELEVVGCMDATAFNYNELASDPGECEPFIFGCIDPTQYNYDPGANTDNGSCFPFVYGCTDVLAVNFDEDANTDNGGCIEAVLGCMDLNAYNFEVSANIANNGTCLYDAGCITGPGQPYWANDSCYSWVIEVDPFCCDTEWDGACQELHNYCELGWPTDVTEIEHTIRVYPNPVQDYLTIACANLQSVEVHNSVGQRVYQGTASTLDTKAWSSGVYYLTVRAYLRSYHIKIVKP